jgi:hypothetical protein
LHENPADTVEYQGGGASEVVIFGVLGHLPTLP